MTVKIVQRPTLPTFAETVSEMSSAKNGLIPATPETSVAVAYDFLFAEQERRWNAENPRQLAGHYVSDKGDLILIDPKGPAWKQRRQSESPVEAGKLPRGVTEHEHQEKVFTFSNGEVKRACSHKDCRWGEPVGKSKCGYRTQHDLDSSEDEVLPFVEPEGDEQSPNDAVELSVENMIAQPPAETLPDETGDAGDEENDGEVEGDVADEEE